MWSGGLSRQGKNTPRVTGVSIVIVKLRQMILSLFFSSDSDASSADSIGLESLGLEPEPEDAREHPPVTQELEAQNSSLRRGLEEAGMRPVGTKLTRGDIFP